MSRFVVDASVAVKWAVPEVHSEAAARLLAEGHAWIAPDLLWLECGNIVWKKLRGGSIAMKEARAILATLRRVRMETVASLPLLDLAFEIAAAHGRTVYDGAYVALAVTRRCPLITADERLFNALKDSAYRAHVRWIAALPAREAAP